MLHVRDATKSYTKQGRTIHAARQLSFHADQGELIVVHGPSGSGKSTLLLMLGGMLPPDSGSVACNGQEIYCGSLAKRNRYRKHTVGFVFQRFFLMPYLSVRDNIAMSLSLQGRRNEARDAVTELAGRLGIEGRLAHRPSELSVGEQQRVALARALVGGQKLILADEPTGNLDPRNAEIIARCLIDESHKGRTVILATHDPVLLDIAPRRIRIESGQLRDSARDHRPETIASET